MDFLLNNIYLTILVIISGGLLIFPNFLSGRTGKVITSKNAVLRINREPSFIIDVRSEEDFNLGHIPNATNIPLEVIDEKIKLITKNSKKLFLIYCQKGIRSDRAVNILSKLGFENTVSIDGGINAWINAQLPIVSK